MIMCDWLDVLVYWPHKKPLNSGNVLSIADDGEVEWSVDKRLKIEGSYASSVQLKSIHKHSRCSHLLISGNLVKWFQGHNVWGTSDLKGLLLSFLFKVLPTVTDDDISSLPLLINVAEVKRIDLTAMFDLGCQSDVLSWLRAAGDSATVSHRGRGQFTGDTLYFGKHSRRWSLKFYAKGLELKKHKIKGHSPCELKSVTDFANRALRAECVIRSMQLKKMGLSEVQHWEEGTIEEVYTSYLSKIEFSGNVTYTFENPDFEKLPARLKGPVHLWREGHDLRSVYPRATWYRYRRDILNLINLDISLPPPSEKKNNNVVPLLRVLEAKPMNVPEWAHGTSLYFEPSHFPSGHLKII